MNTPGSVPGTDRAAMPDAGRRTAGRRANGDGRFGAALSAELGTRSAQDDRPHESRTTTRDRAVQDDAAQERTAQHHAAQDRTTQHRAAQDRAAQHHAAQDRTAQHHGRTGRHRAAEDRNPDDGTAGAPNTGPSSDRARPARRRTAAEDETAPAATINQSAAGMGIMDGAQAVGGAGDSAAGETGTVGQIVAPAGHAPSSATAAPAQQETAATGGPADHVDHGISPPEAGKPPSEGHDYGGGAAPSQTGSPTGVIGTAPNQTGTLATAPGQSDSPGAKQTQAENAAQNATLNPATAQGRPGDPEAPAQAQDKDKDQDQAGRSIAAASTTETEANGTTPDATASGPAGTAAPDVTQPANGTEDRLAEPIPLAGTAGAPPARDAAPGVPDQALAGMTAPAPTAPTTAAAVPPPAPGAAPPAPPATQVAMHIVPLRLEADGVHRLTVHLHPADLGPVQVVAEIRNGDVTMQLSGSTDAGTAALRESLDDLRRELTASGFGNCTLDLQQGGEQARQQYARSHPILTASTGNAASPASQKAPEKAPETAVRSGRLDVQA